MDFDPEKIFLAYCLGIDENFRHRFTNLNSLAKKYNMSPEELLDKMRECRIDPATVRHVDFNVASRYAEAEELAMEGRFEDLKSFAKKAYRDYLSALSSTYDEKRDFEDVDYEKILDDK
ncbi:MAG: hypothetical protein FJ088_11885 [Deltaproteobacteria bacterium]|nr:hypothetical protein [Deltaproteobacteria bacterium]